MELFTEKKVDISHPWIREDVRDILLHEESTWRDSVYGVLPFL